VFDDVYRERIHRGGQFFSIYILGAFGADLAALSCFFESPWRKPVDGLTRNAKGFVLSQSGFDLKALNRLAEAVQPMQAGLEAAIAQKDWENAAIRSSNLSRLVLILGDLRQALDYAKQSVELADRSGDGVKRVANRTNIADALCQAGRLAESEAWFREAEKIQNARYRWLLIFPIRFLSGIPGYQYCDLLLSQAMHREVQNRAGETLKWAYRPLDIALDHLSLGRAYLMQAQSEGTGVYAQATTHLESAVDGLRQTGEQEFVARGLLARAELWRVTGEWDKARRDLDEAFALATRGGMKLFEADCHLEYARLHLACGEKDKARESPAKAKQMIEDMGYHRRDQEVKELEAQV
jgi:tetratricopeptide (TPR) repeat protein